MLWTHGAWGMPTFCRYPLGKPSWRSFLGCSLLVPGFVESRIHIVGSLNLGLWHPNLARENASFFQPRDFPWLHKQPSFVSPWKTHQVPSLQSWSLTIPQAGCKRKEKLGWCPKMELKVDQKKAKTLIISKTIFTHKKKDKNHRILWKTPYLL